MIDRIGTARTVAICVLFGAAVAGCQSVDDLDREIYQEACDNLGIQRGTDNYEQCMMQQQRLDVEQSEGFLDREAIRGDL